MSTSNLYAEVALDVPLLRDFTYKIPQDLQGQVKRGVRVLVPFHRQKAVGFCVQVTPYYDEANVGYPEAKLKSIVGVQSALFTETDFKWLEFAADYYLASKGRVFAQAVPRSYLDPEEFFTKATKRFRQIVIPDFGLKAEVKLNTAQAGIRDTVLQNSQNYFPVLIHGVTGSGKTEIYIEIIKAILKQERSALYLVPEIGMTPQTLARLNAHFKDQLLIYHSGLTVNQKQNQWEKCLEKIPQVLVGTRSALFAPFQNLGMIVIDEEHDSSYKQEERFRYHARDLSLVRAQIQNIPVVLGSATPSLETYYLAKENKLKMFTLTERLKDLPMPRIDVIDFAKEKQHLKSPLVLSQKIHAAIAAHTKRKEQIILFVGQRGHSQNAYCESCQTVQSCPNCDLSLKYHSFQNWLKCHYCDYKKNFDEVCSFCQKKALIPLGLGTQSVEAELKTAFPKLKIVRVDSDAFPSPKKLDEVFVSFSRGDIDLLLGTQMLAKGHDFPNVGFVGVVGIDAHFGIPDFRAAERSFQTLVQVAGRAGRREKQGVVLIQSYFPEHPSVVFGLEQNYLKFAAYELQYRQALRYPPFTRVVQIRFQTSHETKLKKFISRWQSFFETTRQDFLKKNIILMGPTEMPIYKLRGKYRYHVFLKIPRALKGAQIARYFLETFEKNPEKGIEIFVDIDPINLI